MGHREIKRVALSFNWPLGKVWEGYLNPHDKECTACTACEGSGWSPRAKYLQNQWYGIVPFAPSDTGSEPLTIWTPAVRAFAERNVTRDMSFYEDYHNSTDKTILIDREAERLIEHWNGQWCHHLAQEDVDALVEKNRLYDFTKKFVKGIGWEPIEPAPVVTAKMVNEWSLNGFGHDSINCWVCVRNRCEREGVPVECTVCNGEGGIWSSPKAKEICENWEQQEPPTGEGYQLWETVSEGSPSSPVFANPAELARWCEQHATIFASEKLSYRQWLQFITGEEDLDVGSMMVASDGHFGSLASHKERERDALG